MQCGLSPPERFPEHFVCPTPVFVGGKLWRQVKPQPIAESKAPAPNAQPKSDGGFFSGDLLAKIRGGAAGGTGSSPQSWWQSAASSFQRVFSTSSGANNAQGSGPRNNAPWSNSTEHEALPELSLPPPRPTMVAAGVEMFGAAMEIDSNVSALQMAGRWSLGTRKLTELATELDNFARERRLPRDAANATAPEFAKLTERKLFLPGFAIL